ncbi:MAG: hypothetical protein COV66_13870 [Nitrospinae bacterium CG11_big_fil_rev_8_21_14_0_20_45_15]|nr:MAG: hypothetical protein COV66_13870 [Nitrospinae bacterium CG11_big_fil_rev_8_21_14_0_20_45_15]
MISTHSLKEGGISIICKSNPAQLQDLNPFSRKSGLKVKNSIFFCDPHKIFTNVFKISADKKNEEVYLF